MDMMLDEIEIRILGSLIEKALSTPEYYPLSLNALTNACNQKTNREPVVSYEETTIARACETLEAKGLLRKSTVGRVIKYEEILTPERKMVGREACVLCVLFLRGPQTPGEIRGRTSRMHSFETIEDLQDTLADLQEWGYIERLSRIPGHKESRYAHLFSLTPKHDGTQLLSNTTAQASEENTRLDQMAKDIEAIRYDIDALKDAFAVFKKQFE